MKAAVLLGPNKLEIQEVSKPIPKYGEILVKIKATAIKVNYPRILGHESAGEIAELGEGVKNLKVGDKVVMNPTSYCGTCLDCMVSDTNICKNGGLFGREFDGTYAEYVTLSENRVYKLPDSISCVDATTFIVLTTAVYSQRKIDIFPNSSVIVIGEGPAGLMQTKLSKLRGADPVIGISRSKWKTDLAESTYGADYTFNEDVVKRVYELTKGRGADYVIECVGKSVTMNMATELVRPGGTILAFGVNAQGIENFNSYSLYYKDLKIIGSRAMQLIDWPLSIDLANTGKIDIGTIITNRLPLRDLIKGFKMLGDPSQKALRIVIEM